MKIVALGNVAEFDRSIATDFESSALPYVGLEHIEKEAGRFIDGYSPKPLNMLATNFKFSPRHVLYGKLRPYLNKVTLPDFDGVCTTEILPILPNPNVLDRIYLWAFLLSPIFVSWASSQVSGANLPRLDPNLLLDYKIPLPPLTEQRRIAAILSKADRLRRLRRAARQLGDRYLQSVFLEMFGDPEKNMYKWDIRPLGKIVKINPSGQRSGVSDEPTSFLPMASVDPAHIFTDTLLPKKYNEVSVGYTYFENDDVLFAKITPCMENGNIVIAKNLSNGFGFGSTEFHIIRPNEKVNSSWLYGLVKRKEFREEASRWFRGTAGQQRVPYDFLETYQVPLPPIHLQNRFAEIVRFHDRLQSQQREAERQAEMLFQTLLQKAFTPDLTNNEQIF